MSEELLKVFNKQAQQIKPFMEIQLLSIKINFIKYLINYPDQLPKNSKKIYKINLPSQIYHYKDQMIDFINKFQYKSIIININTQQIENIKLWQIFSSIQFSSIKIYCQKQQKFIQTQNQSLFIKKIQQFIQLELKTVNFQLDFLISYQQIIQILLFLLKNQQKVSEIRVVYKKIVLNLELFQTNQSIILRLIQIWLQIISQTQQKVPNQCIIKGCKQQLLQKILYCHKVTYPQKFRNSTCKIINICQKNTQLLTLLSIEQTNSIYIRKSLLNQVFQLKILSIMFSSKLYLELEFQEVGQYVGNLLQFVFQQFKNKNQYFIKFGKQAEITAYSFMFNINGVNPNIVNQVFQLMKCPGHYQFVCYGSVQYIQLLKHLFYQKPFTKFQYFVPLLQKTNEISDLLNKMQNLAHQLKQKILTFCALFNDFKTQNFNIIQQIFFLLYLFKEDKNQQNQ